ncbi:XTP/dITP diphosphatase [Candidatus Avoscillospira sp. LCP25S3_F1]|uniref:XTP/dITP diphosphatase n=1 Tax=Candidatus Avoscillospira sp. LCP25S3_F1 TaxID=3438825 RepID=UPI003F90A0FB
MKLVLASKNKGKLRELQTMLRDIPVEVLLESQVGIDLEVEETGTTFEENSCLKAMAVMKASGLPAIADDSGLVVDALDGAPGVYSARYGGLDSDEARTAYLLKNMEQVPDDRRTARFVSVITACFPDGREIQARGECEGVITREVRGDGGFGYDPIFLVPSLGQTFGELPAEEKNRISHRAKALERFTEQLNKELQYVDK